MSIRLTLSAFRATTHRFLPIHPTHNFMEGFISTVPRFTKPWNFNTFQFLTEP